MSEIIEQIVSEADKLKTNIDNLRTASKANGYANGYDNGKSEGYVDGYATGKEEGFKEGHHDGGASEYGFGYCDVMSDTVVDIINNKESCIKVSTVEELENAVSDDKCKIILIEQGIYDMTKGMNLSYKSGKRFIGLGDNREAVQLNFGSYLADISQSGLHNDNSVGAIVTDFENSDISKYWEITGAYTGSPMLGFNIISFKNDGSTDKVGYYTIYGMNIALNKTYSNPVNNGWNLFNDSAYFHNNSLYDKWANGHVCDSFRAVIENDVFYLWVGDILTWELPLTDERFGGFTEGSSYRIGLRTIDAGEATWSNIVVKYELENPSKEKRFDVQGSSNGVTYDSLAGTITTTGTSGTVREVWFGTDDDIVEDISFKNLTIRNNSDSSAYLMSLAIGNVNFENVNIINYAKKPALNMCYKHTNVNIVHSQVSNETSGSGLSSNTFAPIQLRKGTTLTLSKYCHIYSEQKEAPSICITYGDNDNDGASVVNIDNTLTGKHKDVNGVVIQSATPTTKWEDIINIDGTQIHHIDDTKKGGKSNIDGWMAYDVNDWDRTIIFGYTVDYDGYVYTDNINIKPDDYLDLF